MKPKTFYSWWPVIIPILTYIIIILNFWKSGFGILIIMGLALLGCVFAAVHHAEVISNRLGEPFGTLILALAVTIIEVALIVSLMLANGEKESALARDTIFAEIMIILNGMIGASILIGGIKFNEQSFGLQGISSALTILVAMSVLTLILPNYTETIPGPVYSTGQLVFVAIVTLILYAFFIFFQNVKHRAYFLADKKEDEIITKPTVVKTTISLVFLFISLAAVVLIAEQLSPVVENSVEKFGAPKAIVGVIIACIVLLPEGFSAVRATNKNNLQKSLNFSFGSALASIGLTIPVVAIISIYTGIPLSLGIDIKSTVLFVLTLLVIILSLSTGKTTGVEGVVLLVILAVYIFTIVVP
jgi:Ca2+:H+ antiporter